MNEYWEGNVYLAKAYRKAYHYKQKEKDNDNYMKGLYNFHSVSRALSNFHLDGKKHKANGYLEEPFGVFDEEEKKAKEQAKAEKEKQELIVYLNSLKSSWDRKHKEG